MHGARIVLAVFLAGLFAMGAAAQGEKLPIYKKTSAMILRFTVRPTDGKRQEVELLNKHGLCAGKSRTVTAASKTCA